MNKALTIRITFDCFAKLRKLPRKLFDKTQKCVETISRDSKSPGLNIEKIKSAGGTLYSARVDDGYRAIFAKTPERDGLLLLWVGQHDKAYEWANRHKSTVNPVTGVLQLYAVEEIPLVQPRPEVAGLFDGLSDDDLALLSVPADLMSRVRAVTTDEEFYALESSFPEDAFENLFCFIDGLPVESIIHREATSAENHAESIDGGDLAQNDPFKNFLVFDDDLIAAFDAPLEKWRIFLHPTQRELVERSYNGPARALGAAGTGKTVVALYRTKNLAIGDNTFLRDKGKTILLTTFSKTLASDMEDNLEAICSKDACSRVDVINLDAWLARFMREQALKFKVEYRRDELKLIWEQAIRETVQSPTRNAAFYLDEWSQVVMAQGIANINSYLAANRVGRGTPLGRNQRKEAWAVIERYKRILKDRGVMDKDYAMETCARLIARSHPTGLYRHVVVDEGQDFSPSAYRLIRAIAGFEHPNDIFITGDSHQRIYERNAVLSRCGINISGRGNILRMNYRTTEEIQRKATAILDGLSFDDMDEGVCDSVSYSLIHGPEPEIRGFNDREDEAQFVSQKIKSLLQNGVNTRSICIVARSSSYLEGISEGLRKNGLPIFRLCDSSVDDASREGIRLSTMHRAKGLEFDYVFVVGVSEGEIPPRKIYSQRKRERTAASFERNEKCLLYVAMTRAKKEVFVSYSGEKSSLLK